MYFRSAVSFDDWRGQARELLFAEIPPQDVAWNSTGDNPSLFQEDPLPKQTTSYHVPKAFLELAKQVAAHRDPARFELLYRTLRRITHGEKHLLEVIVDEDVHRIDQMRKAVKRDIHKMKAFVRFRLLDDQSADDPETENEPERYIAWHEPDHRIVSLAAPFFARRFKGMHWSILTPDESAHWNLNELTLGPGVQKSDAPDGDVLEDLWKTYYRSIFNPARVKIKAMKAEMPMRYWKNMPETELIDELIAEAPSRVEQMIQTHEGFDRTAADFFDPAVLHSSEAIHRLGEAAQTCRACSLHECANQVVFGQGPSTARIVLIGEQPGDQEDLAGEPFVGPAGKLLDQALSEAGLDRRQMYVTNVVKHFKFVERGKRRIHQKPNSREIYACRPWLEAELMAIKPDVLLCLGATPAQAMFGRDFKITKQRGTVRPIEWCKNAMATWHPAAILRMPDADRKAQMQQDLVNDLQQASALLT